MLDPFDEEPQPHAPRTVSFATTMASVKAILKIACKSPLATVVEQTERLVKSLGESLKRRIPKDLTEAHICIETILDQIRMYVDGLVAERHQSQTERDRLRDGLGGASAGTVAAAEDSYRTKLGDFKSQVHSHMGAVAGLVIGIVLLIALEFSTIVSNFYEVSAGDDAMSLLNAFGAAFASLLGMTFLVHYGLGPLVIGDNDKPRFTIVTILSTLLAFGGSACLFTLRTDFFRTLDNRTTLALRILLIAAVPLLALAAYKIGTLIREHLSVTKPLYKEIRDAARDIRNAKNQLARLARAEKAEKRLNLTEDELLRRVMGNDPQFRQRPEDQEFHSAIAEQLERLADLVNDAATPKPPPPPDSSLPYFNRSTPRKKS